jgi:hypothetical protein
MRFPWSLILPVLAVAVATQTPPAEAAVPRLRANVGPGFTITLKRIDGRPVTKLRTGVYTILVTDRSKMHNFHLRGNGTEGDVRTGVRFVGKKVWRVRLTPGRHQYVCDRHPARMKGSFTVF